MDPGLLLPIVIEQILWGSLIALCASGLSLTWGVMGIINISHGSMIGGAAIAACILNASYDIDPILAIPIISPIFFLIGFVVYKFLISPMEKMEASFEKKELLIMFVTFGLSYVAESLMYIFWGGTARAIKLPSWLPTGLFVSSSGLLVGAVSATVLAILYLFLTRTEYGITIRAVTQNREGAVLMGIRIERVNAITFGLAAAIGAIAGPLVPLLIAVVPSTGFQLLLPMFSAILLGGRGSILGCIAGATFLGITQGVIGTFMQWSYASFVSYLLVAILILVRPEGILGKSFRT